MGSNGGRRLDDARGDEGPARLPRRRWGQREGRLGQDAMAKDGPSCESMAQKEPPSALLSHVEWLVSSRRPSARVRCEGGEETRANGFGIESVGRIRRLRRRYGACGARMRGRARGLRRADRGGESPRDGRASRKRSRTTVHQQGRSGTRYAEEVRRGVSTTEDVPDPERGRPGTRMTQGRPRPGDEGGRGRPRPRMSAAKKEDDRGRGTAGCVHDR